ncbi:MAG TPA: oligosaccharide flippase family protein [Gaiellaceae bacterium]|jgi:O-antigen/teichoic acid export membrane protein|nr:oligosaccharide flippase family protein [Gaiellaceae bacterium]
MNESTLLTPVGRAASVPSVRSVRRALSWVGAGQVIGQCFWYGSLLILAALLAPSTFGTITVGWLLVSAAMRLMEAGTRGAIITASELARGELMTRLGLNIASGAALSGLIVATAAFVARTFAAGADARVIAVLGFSVLLYAPAIVPLALLERNFQFKRRSLVQTGSTITAATLAVAAAALGAGVWALVVRQLLLQLLLAVSAWIAARRLLPARGGKARWTRLARSGAFGFLIFSLTDMIVFNADYMTVGHFTDATQLGLYSLAFTLAFAPVIQLSAQIGLVLFPASAASDVETVKRRTIAGVRLTCLVLVPLVPVAVVLAPDLIPGLLGEKWRGAVLPFQILLVVGVAHAVVNVIGDTLSGSGRIGWRARVNAVWGAAMVVTLLILVQIDGIRGASLSHLLLYPPVALAYGIWGMRMLGVEPRLLAHALRPIAELVALLSAATVGAWLLMRASSMPAGPRDVVTAAVSACAAVAWTATRGGAVVAQARTFLTAGQRV